MELTRGEMGELDPMVQAVFVALQQFDCGLDQKVAALFAAVDICRASGEIADELEKVGEVAVTPMGMVRLGNTRGGL